jgi:DNA repair exonuclease SbcCD ATPase subunit
MTDQLDITSEESTTSQERYADELAGPDDYWLTLTDAARATRRQDVTIRRWISKGLLPVRRQHVGLNQRTRLVRASDLAALTPIIDPAGAISTERGKLDLTSIPTQQAQIKASQQHVLAQLEDLHNQLQKEAETTQHLLAEQDGRQRNALASLNTEMTARLTHTLVQLRTEIEMELAKQQAEVERSIQTLETRTTTELSKLAQRLSSLEEQGQALARVWHESIEQFQQQYNVMSTNLQQEVQAREQLDQQVAMLREQLSSQQAKHDQEVQLRKQLAEQVSRLTEQLTQQQARYEREVQTREQLAKQVAQLMEQHTLHEQVQQQLTVTLAQQQDTLSSLVELLAEERRRFDDLSQYYVKLEQQATYTEQKLVEMHQELKKQRQEMLIHALSAKERIAESDVNE